MKLQILLFFLVDSKIGLIAQDSDIATLLRKSKKEVILVVNKVDNIGNPPPQVYEFYNLGLGDFVTISSSQGLGMGDLLDVIYDKVKKH